MKTLFLQTFAAALASASLASAFSLYDTAPMVGVPESQAARYFFGVTYGYDSNPQASSTHSGRKAGTFVNAAFTSTYADVESIDKLSYNVRLGGTRYFGETVNGRRYYGDCGASVTMVHAFSAMSQNSLRASISYMPEPGYDDGVSSQGRRGDTLTWNVDDMYSQAIDARWSWNVGLTTSGTDYSNAVDNQSNDNRQYLSARAGLNYKESDVLTYTASVSAREEWREYGTNSRSCFGSVGFQRALDMVSTISVSVGAQQKMVAGSGQMSPTLDVGYRRRVTDGLSLNAYAKYSNENINSYSSQMNDTYRSCGTWRIGVYGVYVLSPDVSYDLRLQYIRTEYARARRGQMPDSTRSTINPSLTMKYNFSADWQGSIGCEYTFYTYKRGEKESYTRWEMTTGLTYRF